MLNLIKIFVVINSIHFFTIGMALGNVSSCYHDYDNQLLFTATVTGGSWRFESRLGANQMHIYTPCYINEDVSLILNRSTTNGSEQLEISIKDGTNRTKGELRIGSGLDRDICSVFGIYAKYTFTCDNPIP